MSGGFTTALSKTQVIVLLAAFLTLAGSGYGLLSFVDGSGVGAPVDPTTTADGRIPAPTTAAGTPAPTTADTTAGITTVVDGTSATTRRTTRTDPTTRSGTATTSSDDEQATSPDGDPVSVTLSPASDDAVSLPGATDGPVSPGEQSARRFVVTNEGRQPGRLSAAVTTGESRENGLTNPEREAGDAVEDGGELDEFLGVRISVRRADGSREYLVGGRDHYVAVGATRDAATVSLAAGERATLRVGYHLPPGASDVVQSDTLDVGVAATLTGAA